MARPRPEKKPETPQPPALRVLPMQLQIGDRLADETGEWEVIDRPYTTNAGKDARVRVQRVDQPDVTEIRIWRAYERVRVKRATAEEGQTMMRLRRASVIAALSLLTSAATAYAECAWVLWTRTKEPGVAGWWNGPTWKAHSAYTSKSACEDPLGILPKAASDPIGVSSRDLNVKCFPDTVDPRGPKGK
jgi:hypothetical protein